MKKIVLFAIVLMTIALGFTACGNDDIETSNYNIAPNAGAAVAKTYNGTWTLLLDEVTTTSPGTITLEATEESHVVKVTIAANPDLKLDESVFNANITQKSNTRFSITLPVNNAFTTQTGFRIIVDNGEIESCDFIKSLRGSDRKLHEYFYNFKSI